MKTYEEVERAIVDLKTEIKNGIKEALKEKGYPSGSELPYKENFVRVDIKYGGLVIVTNHSGTEYNIDMIPIETALPIWREVIHIIPNIQ